MRTFLIVITLAVGLPIYGQEKAPKPNSDQNPAKSIEHNQATPTPPPIVVVNQQTSTRDKEQPYKNADSYLHHLLSPEVLTSIGLLIAAGIGICVTVKTLKAIRRQALVMIQQARILARQTKATEEAVVTAKQSSDILANIERAWVEILVRRQTTTVYFWELVNYGRTVAHVKELRLVTRLTPSDGSTPSEGERIFPRNKLLVPQAPWTGFDLDLIRDLSEETFRMVRNGEMRLTYHLTVLYEGIVPNGYSESLHYFDSAHNYQCLRPVEAPEYNKTDQQRPT